MESRRYPDDAIVYHGHTRLIVVSAKLQMDGWIYEVTFVRAIVKKPDKRAKHYSFKQHELSDIPLKTRL